MQQKIYQCQAFIQAVSLMSVFWTKIEFSNVARHNLGSQGVLSSATGSWWSPGGGSESKSPEILRPVYIWTANK